MSHRAVRTFGSLLAACGLLALAPIPPSILGFTPQSGARERADEALFLDLPSAQGAYDAAAEVGARPHYAGTPADYRLAVATREKLREYGFDARLEPFTARVDTPRTLVLELYADGKPYKPRDGFHKQRGAPPVGLDLREPGDPVDPDTLNPAVGLPFNAGSGNGDVIAPLVYVNRGLPADYATLRAAGVDVRGAVALIRYGAAFRGTLARAAQDAGAAGALLYDDPADDGAARGPAYPAGPWRPENAIQRGTLGPGIRIPVLPIGSENARTLLRALHGPAGPAGWAGALDAPYPVVKGPAAVHLAVVLNHERRTLWNTVGRLAGTRAGNVILGAHRDAWVYGVGDNGAGTTALLETARGLGYLARSGRRPRRTITVALWDGEEIGLAGSASFAQSHAAEIRDGTVAYLNADENVTGTRFGAVAVEALAPAVVAATAVVADPARERSTLHDRWSAQPRGIDVAAPGGGSDHEAFLFGFGTPVAEMGFRGPFGPYHSSFDTLRYAWTISDPGFVLHRTSAQLYGILALRLANADVAPYAFGGYVATLQSGLLDLQARAQRDGRSVDLAPLAAAIARFAAAARDADADLARGVGPGDARALAAVQQLDRLAYGVDGYAAVAFPSLAAAYADGPTPLRLATGAAAAALDDATAHLR